jgi:hypothetical protein
VPKIIHLSGLFVLSGGAEDPLSSDIPDRYLFQKFFFRQPGHVVVKHTMKFKFDKLGE